MNQTQEEASWAKRGLELCSAIRGLTKPHLRTLLPDSLVPLLLSLLLLVVVVVLLLLCPILLLWYTPGTPLAPGAGRLWYTPGTSSTRAPPDLALLLNDTWSGSAQSVGPMGWPSSQSLVYQGHHSPTIYSSGGEEVDKEHRAKGATETSESAGGTEEPVAAPGYTVAGGMQEDNLRVAAFGYTSAGGTQEDNPPVRAPGYTSAGGPQEDNPFLRIIPDPSVRPFEPRAAVTLLTSAARGQDNYFLSVAVMMYRLTSHEDYRLPRGVEAAVLVNENVSEGMIRVLRRLGARVFVVASIERGGSGMVFERWRHCFTKLYLFRMTFYSMIAFMDADMFVVGKLVGEQERGKRGRRKKGEVNQESIFSAVEDASKRQPGKKMLGAVVDGGWKTFNAGMLVLEPSEHHFYKLMSLIPQRELYDDVWMEQGLLNYYFGDTPNPPANSSWVHMDRRYNARGTEEFEKVESEGVVLIHAKFFNKQLWDRDQVTMYHWFQAIDEVDEELKKLNLTLQL